MTKRIREVFPAEQVAHLWANQSQEHARNPRGNIFFHGATIYSYRASYAMATISPWRDPSGRRLVIMRETRASVTTGRHMSAARNALVGHPVYIVRVDPAPYATDSARKKMPHATDAALSHFSDYAKTQAAGIEAGNPDTAAGIVGALVMHARRAAAEALDRISADRIAYQYRKAAEYIADARAIAEASAATLKGNARRAHVARLARILAEAPELPAGFVERAAAEAMAPEYPRWNDPAAREKRAAHDAARKAAADKVPGDPAELARALWRKLRDARKEGEQAVRLAARIKAARASEKTARELKDGNVEAPDAARRDAWRRAAQEWRGAATVAAIIKRPAAERAKYRAAADKAEARAERLADSAAVQEARAALAMFARNRAGLARLIAKGRRGQRERRVLTTGAVWRPADGMPSAWREAKEPAHKFVVLSETVGEIARAALAAPGAMGAAAGAAMHGRNFTWREYAERVAAVAAVADKRGRYQAEARRLIAELSRVAEISSAEARAALRKIEGRAAAVEIKAQCERVAPFLAAGAIGPENAEAAISALEYAARILPGPAVPADDMQVKVMRACGVESAGAVRAAIEQAAVLRDAARALDKLNRAYQNNANGISSRAAADRLAAGLALDAERAAGLALSLAENRYRAAAEAAEEARTAAGVAGLPEAARAAWRAVGERAAAILPELAAELAECRNVAEAARQAAAAARADLVAHWRATGEGRDELMRAAGYGVAYFRRSASGSIVSSLGAEVPEAAGRRLWALIRATVAAGQDRTWPYGEGPRVGHFKVERVGADGSAKVGCHLISAAEARAFARFMAWPPFGAATAEDCTEATEANA